MPKVACMTTRLKAKSLGYKHLQDPRTHNRFPNLKASNIVPPCPEQKSKSIKLSPDVK